MQHLHQSARGGRGRPVYGVGFLGSVLGSVLSATRAAKTLQGDPTTHPRRTQEADAGAFSWGPARAFNTCGSVQLAPPGLIAC